MAIPQNNKSSVAYNLSLFEEKNERRTLRVIKNNAPRKNILTAGVSPATIVFMAIIVLSITSLFIYNNAMLTEVGAQIAIASKELATLESETVLLETSLDAKMSVKNIEISAESGLGLVKMDRSQIEYINLAPDDVVEVAAQNLESANIVEQVVAKIKEYLDR